MHVLVIDDDLEWGNVILRVLALEHEVVVLTSAKEALGRLAAGEQFDLVLCELQLPGMSGMTFHLHLGSAAPEMVERAGAVPSPLVQRRRGEGNAGTSVMGHPASGSSKPSSGCRRPASGCRSVAFAPDGRLFVGNDGNGVIFWIAPL